MSTDLSFYSTGAGGKEAKGARRAATVQGLDILQPGGPFDITPAETASLKGLEDLASGDFPRLSTQALTNVLTNTGPRFEQFFNQAIKGPALRDFSTDVIPTLDRELARSGYFGSARANQLNKATQNLVNFLTETRAKTALEALNTQLSASQAAPASMGILLSALAAAGTPRSIEDARLARLLGIAGTETETTQYGGGGGGGGGSNTGSAIIQALGDIASAYIGRP